jgi:DHA1 family bicyclomycin/chloramphenicol resistance-like MFS transporter
VRDLYSGAPAEKILSLVTMIFSIAPAIAPIIGGWIVSHSDWRTIFLLLFVYTSLLLIACYKYLPESLPVEKRQTFNTKFLWVSYRDVFQSPRFYFKAGTIACNFAGIFLFISSAPAFVTQHLKLDAQSFGWQFVPMVGGIFLGSLAANRLAGRLRISKQIGIGFAFVMSAAVFNVLFHFFFAPMLPWSVVPLFFYAFGMSVVFPGATLMVLELFPHIRGIVASCQSASVTLLSAFVAGIMAPALDHSVLSLALGQLGFALLAMLLWYSGRAYARAQSMHKSNLSKQ